MSGGDVFVVRVGAGQGRVGRMRLGIIPGYFVGVVPQLISVILDFNRSGVKRESLSDRDSISLRESKVSLRRGRPFSPLHDDQGGPLDRRELLPEGVNELLVVTQRLEWVHGEPFLQ
jgi:hypothetical protein